MLDLLVACKGMKPQKIQSVNGEQPGNMLSLVRDKLDSRPDDPRVLVDFHAGAGDEWGDEQCPHADRVSEDEHKSRHCSVDLDLLEAYAYFTEMTNWH